MGQSSVAASLGWRSVSRSESPSGAGCGRCSPTASQPCRIRPCPPLFCSVALGAVVCVVAPLRTQRRPIRPRTNDRGDRRVMTVKPPRVTRAAVAATQRTSRVHAGGAPGRRVGSGEDGTLRDQRGERPAGPAPASWRGMPLSGAAAPSLSADRAPSRASKQSSHRRPKARPVPTRRWSSRPTLDTKAVQPQRWHTPKRCRRRRRLRPGPVDTVSGCPMTPPRSPTDPAHVGRPLSGRLAVPLVKPMDLAPFRIQ